MTKPSCKFIEIQEHDRDDYIHFSKQFYSTDSVLHNIPEKHFFDAFELFMHKSPYLRCIMIQYNDKNVGYATLALTYSIEAGGMAVWAEELYIDPNYRNLGLGKAFLQFLDNEYKGKAARMRLEVAHDKNGLVELYKKNGYQMMPYVQMYKDYREEDRV